MRTAFLLQGVASPCWRGCFSSCLQPQRMTHAGFPAPRSSVFTGKVVTDEVHYTDRFERGGKYEGVFMNKRHSGTWEVKDNQLCIARTSEPPDCDTLWRSRSNPLRLQRGKLGSTVRDNIVVQAR